MAKEIPLMKQYHDAKAQHPDMILLFRIGDFYEAFDEDAKTVAKTLGLTLTSRLKGKEEWAMCGFPHHQLETYLSKLLASKKRVAILDQVKEQS